jgi:hypothetical protein
MLLPVLFFAEVVYYAVQRSLVPRDDKGKVAMITVGLITKE